MAPDEDLRRVDGSLRSRWVKTASPDDEDSLLEG
jgi:hypothetical protein